MMIATVWVLAFTVSCPLLFGFNTTGQVNNIFDSTFLSRCIAAESQVMQDAEWNGRKTPCYCEIQGQNSVYLLFSGSAVGHEMQSKMGFKGALDQFSMSDSLS